jgi:hypothetical protein
MARQRDTKDRMSGRIDIEDGTACPPAVTVRIGNRSVSPSEIIDIEVFDATDWDTQGQLFGAALYLVAGLAVVGLVVIGGWRERFLIFSVMVAAVAIASLQDASTTPLTRYRQMNVRLATGETISLAHPDPAEIERIRATLAASSA